jgi:hypothetical protein
MEAGPGRAAPAGRLVSDVLDAWVQQNLDTWAPSSARDQQSRVRGIGQGHDVPTVAGRLGHANPAMTLRVYAHAFAAADQAVAAALGDLLKPER